MTPTVTRRRARLLLPVLLPVAALALSGCAVGFSPSGAPDAADPRPSTPVEQVDPDETPDADVETDGSEYPTRAEISAAATKQVTCGGGDLEISDIGVVVEVVDDCGTLTVSGDASVVLAAEVDALDISAVGAVVLVASTSAVTLTGDATTVLWESGSPAIDDASFGSVLVGVGR